MIGLNSSREMIGDLGIEDLLGNSSDSENGTIDSCKYHIDHIESKFIIVGIVGTATAILSTSSNLFLFWVFIRIPRIFQSPLLYQTALALLDTSISICYILLMSMQLYMDYFDSTSLYFTWITYFRPALLVSHVTMAASTFVLVVWTFERFQETIRHPLHYTPGTRMAAITFALLAAVLTKGTVYFDIQVRHNKNCTRQMKYVVEASRISKLYGYRTYNMLYFRNIACIFIPFISLAIMNIFIIRSIKSRLLFSDPGASGEPVTIQSVKEVALSQTSRLSINGVDSTTPTRTDLSPAGSEFRSVVVAGVGKSRQSARDAVLTMISLVSMYLLANLLNVLVTFMEYIDKQWLLENGEYYSICADLISLFTITVACFRLPQYMLLNRMIRREIFRSLRCESRSPLSAQNGDAKSNSYNKFSNSTAVNGKSANEDAQENRTKKGKRKKKNPNPFRRREKCQYHSIRSMDENCLLSRESSLAPNASIKHCSHEDGTFGPPPQKHYHATLNGSTEICIMDRHEIMGPAESRV